jgi:GDP-L-fucose synthase
MAAEARGTAPDIGITGRFVFDASKPDGTPRKLDVAKLTALGWHPRVDLKSGIRQNYDWYRASLIPRHANGLRA